MTERHSTLNTPAAIAQRDVVDSTFPSRRELRASPEARVRRVLRAQRRSAMARRAGAGAPRNWRQRISAAGVMVVVIGVFASLTLPAFGGIEGASAAQSADLRKAQTLEAGEDFVPVVSERESYGVTSAADNRALREAMLRDQNLAAYLRSGAAELGDDYPWPAELTREQGGGLSPLRYYYRECVDFVAWRLNVADGVTSSPFKWDWSTLPAGSGNASEWKQAWINAGLPTGTTPSVGAVAWFAGANHVAFVSGILDDGYVLIEEYNWNNDHGYSRRIIAPGDAYYLSAPPG